MKTIRLYLIVAAIVCFGIVIAEEDEIFSHRIHIEDAEMSCEDCHAGVTESESAADLLLPDAEFCLDCHEEDAVAFYSGEKDQTYKAAFSHMLHSEIAEDCSVCHAGIEKQEGYGNYLPGNNVCAECHEPVDFIIAESECRVCHSADMNLTPANHQVGWQKNHGLNAQINDNGCAHCHQQSYCQDCHQGDNLDQIVHGLNYRFNHAIDARGNKDNCLTCHQEQAFCIDCHQTELVMPRNHAFANWSNTDDGGQHARAAQYDFDNCMSCHNDAFGEVVCLTCHQR